MNKELEAIKAETLRGIRASRPQKDEAGNYACPFCTASGDRGFAQWHTCAAKEKQGIKVRMVR